MDVKMTMIATCGLALPVKQVQRVVVVARQPASVHRDTQTCSLHACVDRLKSHGNLHSIHSLV